MGVSPTTRVKRSNKGDEHELASGALVEGRGGATEGRRGAAMRRDKDGAPV